MKKVFIVAAALLYTGLVQAQDCKGLTIGTKTVYPGPAPKYTAVPKGYTPVFINHVGRHGARHLTKDMSESEAYLLLKKADSMQALTPDGQKLWQMAQRLNTVEHKGFKNISYLGKQEQQGIGERMGAAYPMIFSNGQPRLNVTVTKELRTVQSSEGFLGGLKSKIANPQIKKQVNDTTLRFYDMSPVYQSFKKEGPWTATLLQLEKSKQCNLLANKTAGRFFTATFSKSIKPEDKLSFASDIVGFANILYSLPGELKEANMSESDLRFASFFDCDDLKKLSAIDNAEEFLVKGPGTNPAGIQVRIAVPLLIDFIKATDSYITAQPFNADLRFTHAEAIAPFAALMGITGAATPAKTGTDIGKVWNAAKVIPLSANIQWVLYKKNGTGDYLVKFLLNEREVSIDGMRPQAFPYYKWTDVRKFYITKLQKLGATLDTDGLAYLKEAKL